MKRSRAGRDLGSVRAAAYERSLLRRAAWAVVCLKVAIVPIVFDPNAFWAFTQPKVLASNAMDWVLLGLLAATAVYHYRSMLRWSPLHIPVIAFGTAYLLATVFAINTRVAVYGAADRGLGLLSVLDSLLLYAAVVLLVRKRSDLLWLAAGLSTGLLVAAGYELVQLTGKDPVNWYSGALSSTLGNRGVLAQLLGTLGVAFGAVAVAPGIAGWRARAAFGVLASVGIGGALLSGGRAALIGIVAGAAVAGAVRVLWDPGRRIRILGSLGAAAVLAALIAVAFLTSTGQRVGALVRDPGRLLAGDVSAIDPSIASRLDIYRVALSAWRDRPLVGVGPDNYVAAFPTYRLPESNKVHDFLVPQSSTHSWFLKVATDAGALGLASFVFGLGTALVLVLRGEPTSWRLAAVGGIAAYLGTGIVSIDHIGTQWLPWVAMGLIAAPAAGVPRTAPVVSHPRRAVRRNMSLRDVSAAGLVALGVLLVPVAIKDPLEAARAAQLARAVLVTNDDKRLAAGQAAAERSVRLDPGRAEYWAQLAGTYTRQGSSRQAETAWERAVELEPFQAQYLSGLSIEQLRLGLKGDNAARSAALGTARRAAEVDPYFPGSQYALALAANVNGQPEQAVQAAELWVRLRGTPDELLTETAAGAYISLGRPSEAERWIRTLVKADDPGQPKLRVLLARALEMQGRRADALHQVELALKADPKNQDARRLQAELAQ